jgi:hypothetical protein
METIEGITMFNIKKFVAAMVLVAGLSFSVMAESSDAPSDVTSVQAEIVSTDQTGSENFQLDDLVETVQPGDTVTAGWVSEEALSPDDMEAFLTLAHGKRRPSKYPLCPNCTIIECGPSGFCSGHCRRNKQLRICRSRR